MLTFMAIEVVTYKVFDPCKVRLKNKDCNAPQSADLISFRISISDEAKIAKIGQ